MEPQYFGNKITSVLQHWLDMWEIMFCKLESDLNTGGLGGIKQDPPGKFSKYLLIKLQ